MKCNGQNMVFNGDEFTWHCPHCGKEKFAVRSCYNFLKKEAVKFNSEEAFVKRWVPEIKSIAIRAYRKVKPLMKEPNNNQKLREEMKMSKKMSMSSIADVLFGNKERYKAHFAELTRIRIEERENNKKKKGKKRRGKFWRK